MVWMSICHLILLQFKKISDYLNPDRKIESTITTYSVL